MTISELHPELVGRKPRPVLSCPGAPLRAQRLLAPIWAREPWL